MRFILNRKSEFIIYQFIINDTMLYPLGVGGGLWWQFEIKTQDRTLSKYKNPGPLCPWIFFSKLIIWNIDIHTCLLDSTFLCPHVYIIILNLVSIVTINIGLSIMSTAYFIYTMLLDQYIRNTMHLVRKY